jgi:2-polyprenyl-3-methyl-5-hydroxy-6-metoxy-1,4-benzoquinol methylase
VKQHTQHTLTKCPVCQSGNIEFFLKSKDYFLTGEDFYITSCANCGFKFTNPRPIESELSKYYESNAYISHASEARNTFEKMYSLVRNFTIKSKIRIIKKYFKSGTVLDIGSGTGDFLYQLKRQGFYSKGIEANEQAREFSNNQRGLDVVSSNDYKLIPEQSCHVITMWHVLEHIFYLDKQIHEIKRILKSNGVLIIAVPNLNSYDAKYYQNYWAAYDVPRHLYHFEKKTIKRLFENHQFELIKIKPMYFDSFYVSILSEKYKNGKKGIVKPFIIGMISNLKASMQKKNYSSLIYVFKLK